jgi:hypothetical protein
MICRKEREGGNQLVRVLKVKMSKFKTYIFWRKEREQNKEKMRNKRWMETQKEKPNHKKKD